MFIRLWYCIKTSKGNNIPPISWPKGTYCIAKAKNVGCPSGFGRGGESIHWDDYNFFQHERTLGYTVVSRVSVHGCLNITRDFDPHGHLPGIKIPYVCYSDPLKCSTWVLTREWELARDTTVLPDGSYGHDTTIKYCGRSDGDHYTPANQQAINFVLYRYGDRC